MGEFLLTTTIDRQPATVFAVIAEPANMSYWYEAVDDVTLTGRDAGGLGAKFQISRSLPRGRAINSVEITEYEPNRRVSFESRQGPTPFRYAYRLEPIGSGTKVTLEGHISSAGLTGPAAHLGAVATQLFKRGMKRNLEVLKDALETNPSRRCRSS